MKCRMNDDRPPFQPKGLDLSPVDIKNKTEVSTDKDAGVVVCSNMKRAPAMRILRVSPPWKAGLHTFNICSTSSSMCLQAHGPENRPKAYVRIFTSGSHSVTNDDRHGFGESGVTILKTLIICSGWPSRFIALEQRSRGSC
jgi:hypothetical protein